MQVLTKANELLASHAALILRVRSAQEIHRQQLTTLDSPPTELLDLPSIPSPAPTPSPEDSPPQSPVLQQVSRQNIPPAKRARVERYHNYVPEEETIRNDYSQRYVDSGEWPQNWVLGAEPEHRFEEYPKQQRLLSLKKASVNQYSLPPTFLPYSDLTSLHPTKFDVILLDPPFNSTFTWDHLQELPIPSLAGDPSFVFLWVGSGAGEGLERGREVLAKWGYRRCEDVVWVKTNKSTNQGPGTDPPTTSLLTRTKQHCLMGIRGTVRRSTDSWFVHCNVDTDVILWEGDPTDPTRKPPEMYTLIENFCLGVRRLEVFGKAASSLRRGWVTVLAPGQEDYVPPGGQIHVEGDMEEGGTGAPATAARWVQETWEEGVKELGGSTAGGMSGMGSGRVVVPMTSEIDALRPKSPVRPGQNTNNTHTHHLSGSVGGGNMGGGMPMGMNAPAPRFAMNRTGAGVGGMGGVFAGTGPANPIQMMAQNQNQMMGSMMGMGGMSNAPMGMGGMANMGNMEDMNMMGNWNGMMGVGGMGGMNMGMGGGGGGSGGGGISGGVGIGVGAMQAGGNRGMPNNLGMNGMGVNGTPGGIGMQGVGGMGGMPMHMMNQMNQMGMGNTNSFNPGMQGVSGHGGFSNGMPMFNGGGGGGMNMNGGSWSGDQGQFGVGGGGMDATWEEGNQGNAMQGMNVNMMGGMNGMNMGIQPWGGSGNF